MSNGPNSWIWLICCLGGYLLSLTHSLPSFIKWPESDQNDEVKTNACKNVKLLQSLKKQRKVHVPLLSIRGMTCTELMASWPNQGFGSNGLMVITYNDFANHKAEFLLRPEWVTIMLTLRLWKIWFNSPDAFLNGSSDFSTVRTWRLLLLRPSLRFSVYYQRNNFLEPWASIGYYAANE